MHQVRYFLAVARTLNFTRAAEQCNVSQPALTRAIRQLEEELAGKLLRREGKLSHLTDLGERMVPLMQQCYESALAAKIAGLLVQEGRRAGPVARRCRTASTAGCWSARWPRCSAPFPACSSAPARRCRRDQREPAEGQGRFRRRRPAGAGLGSARLVAAVRGAVRARRARAAPPGAARSESTRASSPSSAILISAQLRIGRARWRSVLEEHGIAAEAGAPDRLDARSRGAARRQPRRRLPAAERDPSPAVAPGRDRRPRHEPRGVALRRCRPPALAGRRRVHEAAARARLVRRARARRCAAAFSASSTASSSMRLR